MQLRPRTWPIFKLSDLGEIFNVSHHLSIKLTGLAVLLSWFFFSFFFFFFFFFNFMKGPCSLLLFEALDLALIFHSATCMQISLPGLNNSFNLESILWTTILGLSLLHFAGECCSHWCSKILLFTDFEGFFPPLLLSLPSALFIVLSITGFVGFEPDDRYWSKVSYSQCCCSCS